MVNWSLYDAIVRAISLLTHLGLIAAAAWGFLVAKALFDKNQDFGDDLSSVNLAIFIGMMAVYNCCFGLLGFLAELRHPKVKGSVLKGFGFLHSHIGRGSFMVYVGTVFVLLPWDERKKYVSKIPASFEIGMGLLQIVYGTCSGQREPAMPESPRTPGQRVFVDGEDSETQDKGQTPRIGDAYASAEDPAASVRFAGASTPVAKSAARVLNPLNAVGGAGKQAAVDAPGGQAPIITKNPFLGQSSAVPS